MYIFYNLLLPSNTTTPHVHVHVHVHVFYDIYMVMLLCILTIVVPYAMYIMCPSMVT